MFRAMSPKQLAILVLAASVVGLAGPVGWCQDELSLAPQEGVLLLRNQNVLRGKISRAGDYYFVVVPDGEIRLRTWQVDAVCGSLDEVYRIKSESLPLGRLDGHLELAEWCLRERLFGYAGEQILHARQLDPTNVRVALLERRLRTAVTESERPASTVASKPPAGLPTRTTPTHKMPTHKMPTHEMLDELVRDLPSEAMAEFTGRVQPLLVNHCATAGCHGPGAKSDFRLERIPVDRAYSRRLSQRNLHAVLDLVDREQPIGSPLLALPSQPHGSLSEPVFAEHQQEQYQNIVDWVHLVSRRPTKPAPESVATASPLLQTVPDATVGNYAEGLPRAGRQDPAEVRADDAQLLPGESGRAGNTDDPTDGAQSSRSQQFVPRDPFDPEIFNRRYSRRPAQSPR
jgi:hypothetical protein